MTHNPYRYAHLTAMTDTRDLSVIHRGIPLEDAPTQRLDLYLLPPLASPRPRRHTFRRLLAVLGVSAVVAGLLLAEMALHTLTPVTGGIR